MTPQNVLHDGNWCTFGVGAGSEASPTWVCLAFEIHPSLNDSVIVCQRFHCQCFVISLLDAGGLLIVVVNQHNFNDSFAVNKQGAVIKCGTCWLLLINSLVPLEFHCGMECSITAWFRSSEMFQPELKQHQL